MADGSVTIKVDLDGSGAQSGVSKLKSLFGQLEGADSKVGSVFKSVLGANIVSSALTAGISTVNNGIRDMVSELNGSAKAWKTFEGNLQAFGRSPEVIKAAKSAMQDFATKTIYSASDMASTYAQLDAVGTKNVGSLVKAFGGLAASAENPAQAMKSLSVQATQMAAKPKVAWMDFKIMMEQAPAGMAAVAKEMGMTTAELVSAVNDGKVKTEDFFAAMERAGNSDAFQNMATEFKTVDQAIDGAKESLSNKLMPAFDKVNAFGIKAINVLSSAIDKVNFDKLASGLGTFLDGINIEAVINKIASTVSSATSKLQQFFSIFKGTGAVSAIQSFLSAVGKAISHIVSSITGNKAQITSFATTIGDAFVQIAGKIEDVASWISKLDPSVFRNLATGIIAFNTGLFALKKGIKIASTLKSAFDFGKTLISLIANIFGLTAAQAANAGASAAMSAGNTAVGTTAGAAAVSVMKMGAGVLMVGAGFILAATGVYVLVQAASQLASAGTGAQIAMVAFAAGIALLATGATALAPALTAGAVGILAFGGAILMIGAGIALLATQLPTIATYGLSAAVALISLSAGLLSVGVGALVAGAGLLVAGVGLTALAVGAALAGAATVLLGAGLLVASAGVAAFGVALNICAPALQKLANAVSTVVEAVSGAFVSVLNSVSGVITSIGNAALKAGTGFKSLAQGVVMITNTRFGDMAASLTAVAVGLGKIAASGAGLAIVGSSMTQLATGMTMLTTSSTMALAGMTGISSAITTLQASISTIPSVLMSASVGFSTFSSQIIASASSLSVVNAPIAMLKMQIMTITPALAMASAGFLMFGAQLSVVVTALIRVGSMADMTATQINQVATSCLLVSSAFTSMQGTVQSAMNAILSTVRSVGSQMQSEGTRIGQQTAQNIANGINGGIGSATGAMNALMSAVRSAGMSGVGAMRGIGAMIGQGLAQGMYSALGAVTAAANALVAQAERAAQAKAKIHSPSRLFRDNVGRYIAQGIAVGIEKNTSDVTDSLAYVQKEMSAFRFNIEDLVGIGKSTLSSQFKLKTSTEQTVKSDIKSDKQKSDELIEKALKVAEKATEQPIHVDVDSMTIATATKKETYKVQKEVSQDIDRIEGLFA
ncbi:phage protein [Streptococcus porcinus]|uniref:tape measure protein n=1 Tax=Streptococcus porcinus TaxID=1340 RepID=UPI0010CABAC6|nr:tape measure protein [Streptococcus porcinus]VTS32598.1 phage protein [Streptococcus porcinus]